MPPIVDDAIVLRVWDFSETSQTAALFTRGHGVIRALAKGSRRPKAAYSGGLDLLTRGEAVWIPRPTSELANLTEWDLREVFRAPRERLQALAFALHMVDLAGRIVHDHDPHPALHDALASSLRGLDEAAGRLATLLGFQWAALREAGYRPQVHRDVRTGEALAAAPVFVFSGALGGLTSAGGEPADGAGRAWRVRAGTVDALRWADARDNSLAIPGPRDLSGAVRLLSAHLSGILGHEPPTQRAMLAHLELRAD